jgi:hypothetical protein
MGGVRTLVRRATRPRFELLRVVLPNGASWTMPRPWPMPLPTTDNADGNSWSRAEPRIITVYVRRSPEDRLSGSSDRRSPAGAKSTRP